MATTTRGGDPVIATVLDFTEQALGNTVTVCRNRLSVKDICLYCDDGIFLGDVNIFYVITYF